MQRKLNNAILIKSIQGRKMTIDFLILGSGLSALTFSALMAKAGYRVLILEAHDTAGGFGHTFIQKNKINEYHFNAQLHYVWDCGVGEPVNLVLKKLGVEQEVTFVKYNENGFDHMHIPGYFLTIPNNYELLVERLSFLFPRDRKKIHAFLSLSNRCAELLSSIRKPLGQTTLEYLKKNIRAPELLFYYNKTLQNVFDQFSLPLAAQSLLASQWPDFMLPPEKLSFYCWVGLFDGYMRGAYYPTHHFEHVITTLLKVIRENGGDIIYNQTVINFIMKEKVIKGVTVRDTNQPTLQNKYFGKQIVCNFDPKIAASMIGLNHFSNKLRTQLNYDYSYSNFMIYGAVADINLRDYGFGNWNVFHSEQLDLNKAFNEMYNGDYNQPAFAITTPSLITENPNGCPNGQQLFEILTVANYSIFHHLRLRSHKDYSQYKNKIYNSLINVIERHYIPNFRDHISFKMIGSPTTNKSYCWAPAGNSYGANMTPSNIGLHKLGFKTSFKNFYFCNASAGFAGFAKSFHNGADLYEHFTNDKVLN